MEDHSHRAAVSQQQQMAVSLSQQELEYKEALSQKEQAHVRPRLLQPCRGCPERRRQAIGAVFPPRVGPSTC
eukprot:SAG25_NODE_11304_length_307_cov_1.485577_1_plen_71_part_01